ncbi:hypothetical protein EFY87_13070 [Flexivirga caeni]|uniref:Uncharacterized protein n=1 Tax=Flexivirga caeni TaxID=2294115 RepID=A0A3M9M5J3_9MICO|nr:hypothetical protein EFY87_13070 [Flexivirga caeni]
MILPVVALAIVFVSASRHAVSGRVALLLGLITVIVPVVGALIATTWCVRAVKSHRAVPPLITHQF